MNNLGVELPKININKKEMPNKENKQIIIHTDGAAKGNPGKGGWGSIIIVEEKKVIELGGAVDLATNNQMELRAMIEGLKYVALKIKPKNIEINIYSDSNYLLNGITSWIEGWRANGWQTKAKKDVLNRDYWEELSIYKEKLSVGNTLSFNKVKGHNGDPLNERCDDIASDFGLREKVDLFSGDFEKYKKVFELPENIEHAVAKKVISKKSSSSKQAYSYISMVADKVFADKTWAECEKRVKGKSGAKYKKVFSKEEELDLIALWTLKSLF